MTEYLTPGQYVQEEKPTIKVAETVSSSIGVLVGKFNKGALGKPVLVSSFDEFELLFGNDDLTTTDSAKSFFEQGGTRLYIIRVGSAVNNVNASIVYTADPAISFKAKSGGTWANGYKVSVTKGAVNVCTCREAISASTNTVKVTSIDSWKVGQRVFKNVASVLTFLGKVVGITTTVDGVNLLLDTAVTTLALNTVIQAECINVTVKNPSETYTEVYTGLFLEKTLTNYWVTVINANSAVIDVSVPATIALAKESLSLFSGTEATFTLASGTTQAVDKAAYITALTDVLPLVDVMANVAVVPEEITTSADIADIFNKAFAVAAVCKRFFIGAYVPTISESTVSDITTFRNLLNATEYGAVWQGYTPVFNETRGADVLTPPAGTMLGVMARVAINEGYWVAPAGLHAQILGVNRVSRSVSDSEQATLNPMGVNCIRTFTGTGVLPWGARTLSSNSAMKYITDRLTFNVVEQTILKNNLWSVFRPNDTRLWTSLGISITEFLRAEWKKGALRGASESEAFLVQYGSTVTDWYDVQTGKVHIIIGLATQKPGEFIIYHVYPIVG